MKRSVLHPLVWMLGFSLLRCEGAAAAPSPDHRVALVSQLLRTIADDLSDPADRVAMEQLMAAVSERGALTDDQSTAWMMLTFDRGGALVAVNVNAEILLAAPPLLQRAVALHELEHLKSAQETRQLLESPSERAFDSSPRVSPGLAQGVSRQGQVGEPLFVSGKGQVDHDDRTKSASTLQHIVRLLVDDEFRAYARDLLYVYHVVSAHGGLTAYLATLSPAHRPPMQQYYARRVKPFITPDGRINDQRLRRDFIFLQTGPRHFRRYYEAALAWEALQGHVELRLGQDGHWHPTRLSAPDAFLAWLDP